MTQQATPLEQELLAALKAIADMKQNSTTDAAQISALCIAIARTAIAKAEGR